MKSAVVWRGAGRYAWRMENGTKRWYWLGDAGTRLHQSLWMEWVKILTGMTWADHPDDLHVDEVEIKEIEQNESLEDGI